MKNDFLFLDMTNCVGLDTNLDLVLKSEKVENLKQCFPDKCLKAYEDLNEVYVPKIEDFF